MAHGGYGAARFEATRDIRPSVVAGGQFGVVCGDKYGHGRLRFSHGFGSRVTMSGMPAGGRAVRGNIACDDPVMQTLLRSDPEQTRARTPV